MRHYKPLENIYIIEGDWTVTLNDREVKVFLVIDIMDAEAAGTEVDNGHPYWILPSVAVDVEDVSRAFYERTLRTLYNEGDVQILDNVDVFMENPGAPLHEQLYAFLRERDVSGDGILWDEGFNGNDWVQARDQEDAERFIEEGIVPLLPEFMTRLEDLLSDPYNRAGNTGRDLLMSYLE